MKPTVSAIEGIDPAHPLDQELAILLANGLDEHFGDGNSDYYPTMLRLVALLGSADAAVRHIVNTLEDWQEGDEGTLTLIAAMALRAERQLAGPAEGDDECSTL